MPAFAPLPRVILLHGFNVKDDGAGSILKLSSSGDILFSNPADTAYRRKITVRRSTDSAATWADSLEVYGGSSAYGDLVEVDADNVGLLYERDSYAKIVFRKIALSDL